MVLTRHGGDAQSDADGELDLRSLKERERERDVYHHKES